MENVAAKAEAVLRERMITIPKRNGTFVQAKLERQLTELTEKAQSEVRQFASVVNKETTSKEEAVRRFEEYVDKWYRKMLFDKSLNSAAIVIEADALLSRLRETRETEH